MDGFIYFLAEDFSDFEHNFVSFLFLYVFTTIVMKFLLNLVAKSKSKLMLIEVYSIHVHVLGYLLVFTLLAIDQHQNGAYFFFFGFINTDMKNYTTYCINEIHTFRNSFTNTYPQCYRS